MEVMPAVIDLPRATDEIVLPPPFPEQKPIVYSEDSNICVIAHPATGKTWVLISFALQLVKTGIDPKDILIVSFTTTAKAVVNRRLKGVIKAYTLHGHGLKFSKLGRETFFRTKDFRTKDFDALLAPRESGERTYKWVLCDEGQDLTLRQYESFLSWGDNHFLVGDPWQAMFTYHPACADPTLLNRFCQDFHIEPLSLKVNHRSAKRIVETANKFAGRDSDWEEGKSEGKVVIGWHVPPGLDNITILARTNSELRKLSTEVLVDLYNIPHTLVESKDGKGRTATNIENGKETLIKDSKDYLPTILVTIHCAKGDEWNRVWLLHHKPWGNLEEEDKVFYVGLTRAREELYIGATEETIFTRRLR